MFMSVRLPSLKGEGFAFYLNFLLTGNKWKNNCFHWKLPPRDTTGTAGIRFSARVRSAKMNDVFFSSEGMSAAFLCAS